MNLEKVLHINAPVKTVWEALMDIPYIASCMPSVEKVEVIDNNTYKCDIRAQVSYISTIFNMTVRIAKMIEPELLETIAEGKALGGLGRVNQKQSICLKALSQDKTEALYKSELTITGPIGAFGQKAISAKFDEMAESFAQSFIERFIEGRKSQIS